ncbi:MetQ/NlpA family ABC transporter substrate-binding protein [Cellulomonas sp. ATA003]|uniref:MetQ/NlpA family ABC transporter substrate-binding protein n=1 Tax=Cellulomonas sp. ATA003 TaxID=3073064 RepID=UPI002873DACB|nr:MetQ/NlpA family ABC transporter substrate-binding protein [Cellulomonas sp. ATA003]WNB85808.1 MetQ/NlpA family ABC transporter substrate-binding protein [Cellulomonas sp. ATA003]
MKNRTHASTRVALLAATALALTACGGGEAEPAAGPTAEGGITTLTVGASPTPHAEILEFVDTELAPDAGLDLEIETYDDYVLPNTALDEGDLDANYFQHLPYFESQVEAQGYDFDHFEGVHIEPYALYSASLESLDDLPDGGVIGITNDPGNQSRALDLLVEAELITLEDTGGELATLLDVADNPKNLEFIETAPEQLVRALEDVDAAIINGNYALEADLNPATDSLLLESGEDNPYANFLAVRSADADNEAILALDELLHSPEVKAFIEERWPAGEVLAAF